MRNPAFHALLEEIKVLHDSKSHDYTPEADPLANLRKAEAMGIPAWKGVLVRLTDKWSRIEQLASGKSPKHESLRDSLIDNAVYSLLAILLLDEQPQQSQALADTDQVTVFGKVTIGQAFIPSSTCSIDADGCVHPIEHEDGFGYVRKQECKTGCGCK